MRKAIVSALMIALLLLPGCGEREERLEEGFQALRKAVTAADSIRFNAALTADRGQTVEEYALAVSYDGSQTTLQLLAPETLAGITATALRGETAVAYDGAVLGAGPLDQEGLSPMSAIPVILDAMASAYVELLWWDGDQAAARLYVGESSVATVWLDGDAFMPLAGEISSGGKTVITCRLENWQLS